MLMHMTMYVDKITVFNMLGWPYPTSLCHTTKAKPIGTIDVTEWW
jgi:hypothetical protein